MARPLRISQGYYTGSGRGDFDILQYLSDEFGDALLSRVSAENADVEILRAGLEKLGAKLLFEYTLIKPRNPRKVRAADSLGTRLKMTLRHGSRDQEVYRLADIIIQLYSTGWLYCYYPTDRPTAVPELKDLLQISVESMDKDKVSILISTDVGIRAKPYPTEFAFSEDFITTHYEDAFGPVHHGIIDALSNGRKGCILLHGDPGNGKTTYIKYLSSVIPNSLLIVPKGLIHTIGNDEFISVLGRLDDPIVVLEDAEEAIASRDGYNNNIVGAILNLADGLLSDSNPVRIILTFNCALSEIDKAILRPGRLIAEYSFPKLSADKSDVIRKRLGDPLTGEESSLAELYCEPPIVVKNEEASVGFATR